MVNLLRTGEETGELPEMLEEVALIYDDETERAVAAALKLLEPMLILIMGGLIAGIVAAVILPVFPFARDCQLTLQKKRCLMFARCHQPNRGFTLIEMLLVVVIIGILASAMAVSLRGRSDEAKIATAKSDISGSLSLALDLFEQDMGRYPTTEEGLNVLVIQGDLQEWRGPYLKTQLKPDPWGHPYVYEYDPETKTYRLSSLGLDGQPGTADDVTP